MSTPKYLFFLDIETGGLSPQTDRVLEIAWAVVESETGKVIGTPQSFVVKQNDDFWDYWQNFVDLFVKEMHTQNDLVNEIDSAKADFDTIFEAMVEDLAGLDEKPHLAGRSVHFDRDFLIANYFYGIFSHHLSHQVFDIRSIRTYMKMKGIEEIEPEYHGKEHRALNDVLNDIAWFRSNLVVTDKEPS